MKRIELTVLSRDVDIVIEFLGRRALMHLSDEDEDDSSSARSSMDAAFVHIRESLDKLASAAAWLEVKLPTEPGESSHFPGEAEDVLTNTITMAVSSLRGREKEQYEEKRKVEEALNEARAFASLDAPFSDLDQLSYLTLRVGHVDPRWHNELRQSLADRAVIVSLGSGEEGGDRILAAASRKGRFALDSELKKMNFVPIAIPKELKGVPAELLSGLEDRLKAVLGELEDIIGRKEKLREEYGNSLQSLTGSYFMAEIAEQLKARLVATQNAYLLTGWVPVDMLNFLVKELDRLTEGRIAVRAYDPKELKRVIDGSEKVPVALKHGAFVQGFERMVFSYGAPLYGTIDPTPVVAVFFTILFGIMFGDLGQGMVLFLLGILAGRRGPAFLSKFRRFSIPLMAVGISSMIMGFLNGSFFTNENILVGPTRALTAFLTGRPVDRILVLMPLPEHGGSVKKLFYFFAFTLSLGVLLNSLGLIINTINQLKLKKYEKAFFDRTGLAGLLFFWYALFIAVRFLLALERPDILTFSFLWMDVWGLVIPLLAIILGPLIWRIVSGERPVFAEGPAVFLMEGMVGILEIVSSIISNTMSFLRVGAFALSHAVLSYIVFRFSEEVSAVSMGPAFGTTMSVLILVFGNAVIIILEGLIVTIQVLRLQYYEFFSKFFNETGVKFSPFRFRNERSES